MNDKHWYGDHISDEDLLAALGRALDAADPVPRPVAEYARAGFGWRSLDAELAELVFDSATEELVGVRGEETRQVTFRSPGLEIEVAFLSEGSRRVIGQLVPPQAATVEMRHDGHSVETRSDELGRFSFDDVPTGPISLRCSLGGLTVQTDWVVV